MRHTLLATRRDKPRGKSNLRREDSQVEGVRRCDFFPAQNFFYTEQDFNVLGPIMVQLFVPSVPFCGLVSHPYRAVSISYRWSLHFHGGNTGSNPVGDAKIPKKLHATGVVGSCNRM
jgi:hypothetical protein